MDDNSFRREYGAVNPRRMSAAPELGLYSSLQDGEVLEVFSVRESEADPTTLGAAGRRLKRSNSATQGSHQRHMPIEPLKLPIPRKTKEKIGFQQVSSESREYDDLMNIMTSSYLDACSAACFTYSKPRLINNELLEKEFVEKRREMKSDGRTDKELMESYCFLLTDTVKLPGLCQKGLCVGHSKTTALGNPSKGVYLSRYSDLLQVDPLIPGATGEIIVFKVMKGKMKSIYENMKNLLDPTPCFDSHICKNGSKVTSVSSYRAFEHTQQYFYEYVCAELAHRPRQVLPYAVISFAVKGKDSALPAASLAPVRMNSLSKEGSEEHAPFTVWSGDLVISGKVLSQISLHSDSPPFLPHRLPEKLEISWVMRLDQVTRQLPAELFSNRLYKGSREVEREGFYCSLFCVSDRTRSANDVEKLLQGLEMEEVVLVTRLNDRGFLFLVSSVQMAPPTEREDNWKRCLQALFVFPESRDVAKSKPQRWSSCSDAPASVMPRLSHFVPALHHALIKARANPSEDLSAGVEHQAREYFMGLKDGKVRAYPMGEYESILNERGSTIPRRMNVDSYLRSYFYKPAFYLLSVARATQMVETHCHHEEPPKLQSLIDFVLTCKKNAENEVKRKETLVGGEMLPWRKRRLEQEAAERTLKFLKASQESRKGCKIPAEVKHTPASSGSLPSVFASVGLNLSDFEMNSNTSELMTKLCKLLTDLTRAAEGLTGQELPREPCPFERLATKLGLPPNCDIDLRKQEEMEEQMAGSISSLEGFSPSSHGGETIYYGAAGRGAAGWLGRREACYEDKEEEWQIPWVLIPITGLSSERYTTRDQSLPQDPRFQHLAPTASNTSALKAVRKSPTLSPRRSPPPSSRLCLSPEANSPPSLHLCSSLDPRPSAASSQDLSPDASPPPSPPQRLPPEPSTPASVSEYPSPEPSPPPSPSQYPSPEPSPPTPPAQHPNQGCQAAVQRSAPAASRETSGEAEVQEKKKASSVPASVRAHLERTKSSPSPLLTRQDSEAPEEQTSRVDVEEGQEPEAARGGGQQQRREEEPVGLCDNELTGGSSSSPPHLFGHIDSIVERHLGRFSTELQLVLQQESVSYSYPEPPQVPPKSSALRRGLPYRPICQFSQYVSFYNPCPPVQDYVSSLQDNVESMLTEMVDGWPPHKPAAAPPNGDATLASKVSAFVSSIRASKEDLSDGELSPGDADLCQDPVSSIDGEMWQQHPVEKLPGAAATGRGERGSPPGPRAAFSASSSINAVDHPPCVSLQSRLTLQPSPPSQSSRHPPESSTSSTAPSAEAPDRDAVLQQTDCISEPGTELSLPAEPASSRSPAHTHLGSLPPPPPAPAPAPAPATALSSLISQLQPEVFHNLMDIIKDVRRNSVHFYLHSSEPGDQVYEDIKEHLLKQGNVEQSPVTFLNQENTDSKLLVIIKNADIFGKIHTIPGLVSLKRHPSVVFVGIETLDDLRNNSYNELFVSGGCIISDDLVLNPDFITQDQLRGLLGLLEQYNSPQCAWRWKVHFKTHKKLKEQSRFRRDAAVLLDMLSTYQKRQIIEFLPYHDCDKMPTPSPNVDCVMELQARHTHFRHTILLTEHSFEKFPVYTSRGIIMASIDELRRDFTRLVGYHDAANELTSPEETSPSKEHVPSHPSLEQQPPPQQPASTPPNLSHLSDQLVPEGFSKDCAAPPPGKHFEDLRLAISHLRAERRANTQSFQSVGPNAAAQDDEGESVQDPGRNAASTSLDLSHATLQVELGEDGAAAGSTEGQRSRGTSERAAESRCQRNGTPVRVPGPQVENQASGNSSGSVPKPSPTTKAPQSDQAKSSRYPGKDAGRAGEPEDSDASRSSEDRTSDAQMVQKQAVRRAGSPLGGSEGTACSVTGRRFMGSDREREGSRPHRHQGLQAQQRRPLDLWISSPYGLQNPPALHQLPSQAFPHHGPLVGSMPAYRGRFLGPSPAWYRAQRPADSAPLFWGFQQIQRDFEDSRLGYHNPAGQGSHMYRGRRGGGAGAGGGAGGGGGFNRM